MFAPFVSGFGLGGGLIIAIGAQNAFLLRQGLRREYVLPLCLVFALSDATLIILGVAGLGTLVASSPALVSWISVLGAAFLALYGMLAFYRAARPQALKPSEPATLGFAAAMMSALAFTFLNPHVYLDTVVLVGSLSGTYEGAARTFFAIGAVAASIAWFFLLGYGARLLAPLIATRWAWRALDIVIGIVMFIIAANLVRPLIE